MRKKTLILFLILFFFTASQSIASTEKNIGLSHQAAIDRAQSIAKVQYDLDINLQQDSLSFSGKVAISFVLEQQPKKDVRLDFNGGQVEQLQINGKPAPIQYDQQTIWLAQKLLHQGNNVVQVKFNHPFSKTGTGLYRFVDPVDQAVYLYTHFEPFDANQLFPCFDQPDLRASYKLTVQAPEHWQVISSTRETSVSQQEKQKHWIFAPSANFSTYLFSLHAGPYHSWVDPEASIPSRLFARKSLAQYVQVSEWFAATRFGFDFFQQYFDTPYAYQKYDQIIVPDFNAGAMENVGAVTFAERHVQRATSTYKEQEKRISTILHEMAHMWFGNLVTMKWWNGLWLNESFATYMATLSMANYPPMQQQAWQSFFTGMKNWAYTEDQLVTTHAIESKVPNTSQAFANFDGISYGKGASALKQLAYYLGEDAFQAGIQHYFKQYAGGNTEISDFFSAMEKGSGKSLSTWVDVWIEKKGLNSLQANFQCAAGKIKTFTLHQTAPDSAKFLRPHKTQIGLFKNTGSSLRQYYATSATYQNADTAIADLIGKDCPDFVYPNLADFDYVKVNIDSQSLKTAQAHLSKIEDTFMRTMIWSDLWSMVRDGKLPNQQFAQLALNNLAAEQDPHLLKFVLTKLQGKYTHSNSMLRYLTTEPEATILRQRIEDLYWRMLSTAQPASERQKILFDGYLKVAFSSKGLQRLKQILSAELSIAEFTLDQDRRWKLIQTLATYEGEKVRPLINEELKKDASSRAKKMLFVIDAAIPDPAKKQHLFQQMITDDALSLAEQRMIMWNLFPSSQELMRKGFSDKFYSGLEQVSQYRHIAFLKTFAEHLVPVYCQKEGSDRLQKYLQKNAEKLNPIVLKKMRIVLQEDLRCQMIRVSK